MQYFCLCCLHTQTLSLSLSLSRHTSPISGQKAFQKGGLDTPFVWYVFHPSRVSLLCFSCTKIHDRAERKFLFGGVRKLSGIGLGGVLWYAFQGRKNNKHKQFSGLSRERVGVEFVDVLPFSWGERETHKQNSQEISGKRLGQSRDSPWIIPGHQEDGKGVFPQGVLATM